MQRPAQANPTYGLELPTEDKICVMEETAFAVFPASSLFREPAACSALLDCNHISARRSVAIPRFGDSAAASPHFINSDIAAFLYSSSISRLSLSRDRARRALSQTVEGSLSGVFQDAASESTSKREDWSCCKVGTFLSLGQGSQAAGAIGYSLYRLLVAFITRKVRGKHLC
jgi:hypothetical protein